MHICIFLSLQCCCDCLLVLFCWAYIPGKRPHAIHVHVHVVRSYSINAACLLTHCSSTYRSWTMTWY